MNSSLLNIIWTNEFYRSEKGDGGHDFSWNIRKRNYSYCREREFHARLSRKKASIVKTGYPRSTSRSRFVGISRHARNYLIYIRRVNSLEEIGYQGWERKRKKERKEIRRKGLLDTRVNFATSIRTIIRKLFFFFFFRISTIKYHNLIYIIIRNS